ncbi:hypothetical protein E3P77_01192 [Wallemia ichthyophaga]|nr:hypothetical protein E3P77_01192 [Wallemia ichthyophaga]
MTMSGNTGNTGNTRNICNLPTTTHSKSISPAKLELLSALENHQTLGTRQRDYSQHDECTNQRPNKRCRTITERLGEAVYNTAVVAGGIGVAAYRFMKGSFNFKDSEEDYVDLPETSTTPTRTPRKQKQFKVQSKRSIYSPKHSQHSHKLKDSNKSRYHHKHQQSNERLDNMSAQLSAMISDGQKALTQPAIVDEVFDDDVSENFHIPSSSFTFTQSIPESHSDYSIGDGLRTAAS